MAMAAAVLFASAMHVQAAEKQAGYYGPYHQGPVFGVSPSQFPTYHHASTAGEGYARGLADVIRSVGEADLNHSLAARNYEAAREHYLDNEIKEVETWWARRSEYERNQAIRDNVRRERTEVKLSKSRLKDLAPHEFNRATGEIDWPVLLLNPEYLPHRQRVEVLLLKRSQYGRLLAEEHSELRNLFSDWRGMVTSQKDYHSKELVRHALRFLVRLNREVRENSN